MGKRFGSIRLFLLLCLAAAALVGCLGQEDEAAAAERTLIVFFNQLSQGEYQAAAELYGGSYQILVEYNPDLDPADHPSLLERACRVNGFQCLEVGELLEVEETGPGSYFLTVTFQTADGDIYERGPCCGAGASEEPPHTEFTFRVVQTGDGQYRVLDLPVYVP
jgi:hypothetical protein